jgi:hypothetical protein
LKRGLETTRYTKGHQEEASHGGAEERELWNVECGMWNVECGMWDVGCGEGRVLT